MAEAWEGPPGNLGDPVFVHATSNPAKRDGRVTKLSWPARLLRPGGSASARARTRRSAWSAEANTMSVRAMRYGES